MSNAIPEIVAGFADALDGSAKIEELEAIRDKMDSWIFRENTRSALRGLNDPEEIARLRDLFRRLQRRAEKLVSRGANRRELFRIGGFGGAIAVVGAGVIAVATAVVAPPLLLVSLVGSGVIGWQSAVHSSRTSDEITLLAQIGEIAKELADWKEF